MMDTRVRKRERERERCLYQFYDFCAKHELELVPATLMRKREKRKDDGGKWVTTPAERWPRIDAL